MPDFVGADDLPLLGREKQWDLITQYRMQLAVEEKDLEKAEKIQNSAVGFHRQRASKFFNQSLEALSPQAKNIIRWLGVALEQLGHIQREQGKAECVNSYQEAIPNYQLAGDKSAEAVAAFNLGHAYKDLPALRNLDEAERWYRRSLELFAEGDRMGRGKCHNQLGNTAYQRFNDAKKEGKTEEELLKYLNAAADYYQQGIALLPPDAVDDLAVANNALGVIYKNSGDLERALNHFNNAAKFFESAGDLYHAGDTQFNLALALAQNGRLSDALLYVRAALRNYESYGGRAKDQEDKSKGLIAEIEEAMKKT